MGLVAGVGHRAGAEPVAEAPGDVVGPHDFAELVEVGEEGVLLFVGDHPLGHQGAAAADDPGEAFFRQRQMLAEHRAVDGHVVDALAGLVFDDIEEVLRLHVDDVVELLAHLVDRHGADGDGDGLDDPLADRVDLLAGGEVHDRVGAVADGAVDLGQFAGGIARKRRIAQIRVDLRACGHADADRVEPLFEMDPVGRNDHPPAGDFLADELCVQVLIPSDLFHLGSGSAGASLLDLGHGGVPLKRRIGAAAAILLR